MTTSVVRLATAMLLLAGLVTGSPRMVLVSIVLFCLARGMDLFCRR
jgi:hypothetical protein